MSIIAAPRRHRVRGITLCILIATLGLSAVASAGQLSFTDRLTGPSLLGPEVAADWDRSGYSFACVDAAGDLITADCQTWDATTENPSSDFPEFLLSSNNCGVTPLSGALTIASPTFEDPNPLVNDTRYAFRGRCTSLGSDKGSPSFFWWDDEPPVVTPALADGGAVNTRSFSYEFFIHDNSYEFFAAARDDGLGGLFNCQPPVPGGTPDADTCLPVNEYDDSVLGINDIQFQTFSDCFLERCNGAVCTDTSTWAGVAEELRCVDGGISDSETHSFAVSAPSDGVYRMRFSVQDNVENFAVDDDVTFEFVIDTVPPLAVGTGAVPADVDGTPVTDGATVSFDCDDLLPCTVSCTLDGNDVAGAGCSFVVSGALAEGSHSVVVSMSDEAGNDNEETIVFIVDRTPPAPGVTNPPSPTGGNPAIGLDCDGAGSGIDGCTYECEVLFDPADGSANTNESGPCEDFDATDGDDPLGDGFQFAAGSEDGDYEIRITVTDDAGNEAGDPVVVTFTYDGTPPAAAGVGTAFDGGPEEGCVDLSGDGIEANGNVVIEIFTTDDPPVLVDLSTLPDINVDGDGTWDVQNVCLPTGEYVIVIVAEDEAGNQTAGSGVDITIFNDRDDDLISDEVEDASDRTDGDDEDSDDDGLLDGHEDTNGNGILDEGELDPTDNDTDDDGIVDGEEVRIGTDPLDEDSDDDGLLDGEEITYGTDPLDDDSDGDGLLDGEEVDRNLDPLNPDSDGDGILDGEDSDPNNKAKEGCSSTGGGNAPLGVAALFLGFAIIRRK